MILLASLPQKANAGSGVSTQTPAPIKTRIVYLGKRYAEPPPLSLVDKILTDNGIKGARFGNRENNFTGRLLNHEYELIEAVTEEDGDVVEKAKAVFAQGDLLAVADLEPRDLLAVADLPEARRAIIMNIRTSNDPLRQSQCRMNIFHITPSRAMRADALAQYLVWKNWRHWFLIKGRKPADLDYANAILRAAKRFGAKIVEERSYAFETGSRRVESGHQQVQTQMPMLTQGAPDHDVVLVADVGEVFGEYLPYQTYEPKPVAGTHGLVAVAWHRAFEHYGSKTMQRSFEQFAGRGMTERDYSAWLAVKIMGEAVTRGKRNNVDDIRAFILSERFKIAGFKGRAMNFRRWNQQLRQPILITGARALVSISPQEGFLHPQYLTDTLGVGETETKCRIVQ